LGSFGCTALLSDFAASAGGDGAGCFKNWTRKIDLYEKKSMSEVRKTISS